MIGGGAARMAARMAAATGGRWVPWANPIMTGTSSPAPYVATSKSAYVNSPPYRGWIAFNGDVADRVISARGDVTDWWVALDTGGVVRVTAATVVTSAYHWARLVRLECSNDGTTWATASNEVELPNRASESVPLRRLSGVAARHWRLLCLTSYGTDYCEIAELSLSGFRRA